MLRLIPSYFFEQKVEPEHSALEKKTFLKRKNCNFFVWAKSKGGEDEGLFGKFVEPGFSE